MKTESISSLLAATACACMLLAGAACTDENPSYPVEGGGRVRFSVSAASGFTEIGSRSGESHGLQPVELSDGNSSLFLSPGAERESSRSTVISSDNIASAGVFATMSDGGLVYMNNVEILRSSDWTPSEEYLWPGSGTLHICAYSPYCLSASDEGITSVPAFDGSSLSLEYTTPAAVADQTDLLWASPVDASSSPCHLTFNHALTGVRFVTGSEMRPCTVKKIEIKGVFSRATLDLGSGEWNSLADASDYVVEPDIELQAAEGSGFAAPDIAITDDESTFMLLPQTLGDGAAISLTIEAEGTTSVFEASVAGTTWPAGKTIVYRLSAKPESTDLILSVVDTEGKPVESLATQYTGGKFQYRVLSNYTDASGNTVPVEWDAAFINTDGTPAGAPMWIVDYTTEGNGDTDYVINSDLPEPVFLAMSEHTKALRAAADINSTSGNTPYNLSNATGAVTVENTANTYIVNAPGSYSLPLVYGNAVKNGATNDAAYISTFSNTTAHRNKALLHFINHLGNDISDPYIYNNSGCTPSDAVLVWEDRINLVRNVALSEDGHSLTFDVPAASIRQGNALVAVRDADGKTMWSWQIWITDYERGSNTVAVQYNGTDYALYPVCIGHIFAGDKTDFPSAKALMRFTQKNVPDGQTPLTLDIPVDRLGKTIETGDCASFYQWGRKDPMLSGIDYYYNAEHRELDGRNGIPTEAVGTNHHDMVEESICNPLLFFTGDDASMRAIKPFYLNLWNINELLASATVVPGPGIKTIYDPSPVGSRVPGLGEFKALEGLSWSFRDDLNAVGITTDSGNIYFPLFGYRSSSGAAVTTNGVGSFWVSLGGMATQIDYFHVEKSSGAPSVVRNRADYGFCVRPAVE